MQTSTCGCATTTTDHCASGVLERPRYFPRQMITPGDLTLEATYFRDRFNRLIRNMFGWGVVCGATVCPVVNPDGKTLQPWKVRITPGYIFGPYGDEIVIAGERIVDLRTDGVMVSADDPSGELTDPWCSPVYVERRPGTLWVAVKYTQKMIRPVRVPPAGCGHDETQCEYSRWCDGYEVGFLPTCPDAQATPPAFADLGKGGAPVCPPCPASPWVVLAVVETDADGIVTSVDNCSCRRNVLSFGNFWWQCVGGTVTVSAVTVDGDVTPGKQNVVVTVKGTNFDATPTVQFGNGVQVIAVQRDSDTQLHVTISVDAGATQGERTMTVINLNCATATFAKAFTIVPAPNVAPAAPPSPAAPNPPRRRKRPG